MATSAIAGLFAQRVVVGVGDLSVSNNPHFTLSTYALGSCVAVAAYDPDARIGGLLHFMLPESVISPAKAQTQPAMFGDTGLPLLFRVLEGLSADLTAIRIFLAGGANVLCDADTFRIGERNIRTATEYVSSHGYVVAHRAVSGTLNRTLHLNIGTGEVALKTAGNTETYHLGG